MSYTKEAGDLNYTFKSDKVSFELEEVSILIMENHAEYVLVSHGQGETLLRNLNNKRFRNKHLLITSSAIPADDINVMITRGIVANNLVKLFAEQFDANSQVKSLTKIVTIAPNDTSPAPLIDDDEYKGLNSANSPADGENPAPLHVSRPHVSADIGTAGASA